MDSDVNAQSTRVKEILARVNRIPTWSLPASFLAIIGIGYFFTFYDISDIGLAMPAIDHQFNLSNSLSLFLALSIGLIGYAIGSFVVGAAADTFGRFRSMILTMGLTAIGSFGDALSINVPMLVIFRFITGLGLGADLNLVSSYISEFAPPKIRGKITVYTFIIGILGQAVTPFVALALITGPTGPGWRYLFIIGGIIAVIALIMRFELPESPRWLALRKGDLDHAEKVLKMMEESATKKIGKLPEPKIEDVVIEKPRFPMLYLFRKPYSYRLGILVAMWFFWYIGNYGFLGDAASIVSSNLSTSVSSSIMYIAVGAIGYPIGAAIMVFVADRFERKYVILMNTIIWMIGMLLFSTATRSGLFAGSFLASLALGMYLQVAYTFTAESYPTRARSTGFALTDGIGHIGGAVGALILPVVVATYSFSTGFVFIAITGLIAGLIAIAGPTASGRSLEEVSA